MGLAKQLQDIIKRDLGLVVELPQSINRGYWQISECYRWQAKEVGSSRYFYGEDAMAACVKYGVTVRQPNTRNSDWHIDANIGE